MESRNAPIHSGTMAAAQHAAPPCLKTRAVLSTNPSHSCGRRRRSARTATACMPGTVAAPTPPSARKAFDRSRPYSDIQARRSVSKSWPQAEQRLWSVQRCQADVCRCEAKTTNSASLPALQEREHFLARRILRASGNDRIIIGQQPHHVDVAHRNLPCIPDDESGLLDRQAEPDASSARLAVVVGRRKKIFGRGFHRTKEPVEVFCGGRLHDVVARDHRRVGGGALDCSRASLRPPLSWVEDWRAGFAYTFRPRHVSSSLHVGTRVCSHLVSSTDWYQKTFASIRRGTIRFSSATGGHQPQWTGRLDHSGMSGSIGWELAFLNA